MILRRLYELAEWANLLNDPSVIRGPVGCVVKVGRTGGFNGLIDLREDTVIPAKGKSGKPKSIKTDGPAFPIPIRPVVWDKKTNRWKLSNAAVAGAEKPAVFLADTLPRVLPVDRLVAEAASKKKQNAENEVAKSRAQRDTFWRFLRYAADELKHPTLLTLAAFGERIATDTEVNARIQDAIEEAKLPLGATCTLELTSDAGNVLEQSAVMKWWREFYQKDTIEKQAGQFRGLCQVTQREAPIPASIQTLVNGLGQIGCRPEAYLIASLDSTNSYGLEGARAAMVSARGADGFTRALHALIRDQLPSRKDRTRAGGIRSSLRVGTTLFLFWTRDMESSAGLEILDASPDQFAGLLDSLHQSANAGASIPKEKQDQFRVLALSGNSARVVVRDYLEGPLPELQGNILQWFDDLRIADPSKEHQGRPNDRFPLWLLANATSLEADRVAPDTHSRLMQAALTGGPLPDSVLIACLGRLRVPDRDPKKSPFTAHRMGLIKLCLIRKGIPVNETCDANERHPAYVYGRLLEVFAQIQYAALGQVNSDVVDKFYGTLSAAPAQVFGRLFANARNHLKKVRGEKPKTFNALERRLTELRGLLTAVPPPSQFSPAEQGRFALGFYHEKAMRFERIAKRKAKEAEKKVEKTTRSTKSTNPIAYRL